MSLVYPKIFNSTLVIPRIYLVGFGLFGDFTIFMTIDCNIFFAIVSSLLLIRVLYFSFFTFQRLRLSVIFVWP